MSPFSGGAVGSGSGIQANLGKPVSPFALPCAEAGRLAKAKAGQQVGIDVAEVIHLGRGGADAPAEVGESEVEDGDEDEVSPGAFQEALLEDDQGGAGGQQGSDRRTGDQGHLVEVKTAAIPRAPGAW